MKMKLSDYVIQFVENLGVKHIFLISGGGCIHLIDSVGKAKKLQYVCNHHEQASAIATEAYARITGKIGVCLVTSGPGGTNALTGLIGAWLDSIPVLFISGQIKRETIADYSKMRQLGDQEINIVDMVKPVTKYAVTITEPDEIQYHLEKAVHLATTGRPGPVWINIPLDVQGSYIEKNNIKKFNVSEIKQSYQTDISLLRKLVAQTLEKLQSAKRPVLLVGNGVHLAKAEKEILQLIALLKIPVLTSFVGYDLIGTDNQYYVGRPGTVGQRAGNFTMQNSDVFLVIGSRMNIRAIGYEFASVLREAYKIFVDIDVEELQKKTIRPDLAINFDAKEFINEMIEQIKKKKISISVKDWNSKTKEWQKKYPTVLPSYKKEKKHINIYYFIETLSKHLKKNDVVTVSDGSACVCPYQALTFPQGTRIVINSGCAAMGYGLPAAIGACFAHNKKNTICLEGDGSMQLNIQELQTIIHHKLPIKIFYLNNDGYTSIKLTQNSLFEGHIVASDKKSGVSFPNIIKIARAYGIKTERIAYHAGMDRKIKKVLSAKGPIICEVMLSPDMQFLPKASSKKLPDGTFTSRPLEDMYPFLPPEELQANLFIQPWPEKK